MNFLSNRDPATAAALASRLARMCLTILEEINPGVMQHGSLPPFSPNPQGMFGLKATFNGQSQYSFFPFCRRDPLPAIGPTVHMGWMNRLMSRLSRQEPRPMTAADSMFMSSPDSGILLSVATSHDIVWENCLVGALGLICEETLTPNDLTVAILDMNGEKTFDLFMDQLNLNRLRWDLRQPIKVMDETIAVGNYVI